MTLKPSSSASRALFWVCAWAQISGLCLPAKAAEHVYSMGGQSVRLSDVTAPTQAQAHLLLLIAAAEPSLAAATTWAGFEAQPPVCDAPDTAWSMQGSAPDVLLRRWASQAARQDSVALWRLPGSVSGMPIWAVFGRQQDADAGAGAGLCTALEADLETQLSAGISRVHTAAPLSGATRPVPWIELRHAAAELHDWVLPPSFALCAPGPGTVEEDDARACLRQRRLPPPLPLSENLTDSLIWRDNVAGKEVALTFDACSTFTHGEYNPAVIDALIANQVSATLFIGGHWAEMHPKELQWLAAQPGFELGNHTYSHPHMAQLTPEEERQELEWTQQIIFELTGRVPRYFRPPYGEISETLIHTAAQLGLYTVEYDLPAGDADYNVSDARLIDWVVGKACSGSIVIMHMNRPGNKTAEVLPSIAHALRAKGFEFSKLGDMLNPRHAL